jgi:hypothetical protein
MLKVKFYLGYHVYDMSYESGPKPSIEVPVTAEAQVKKISLFHKLLFCNQNPTRHNYQT